MGVSIPPWVAVIVSIIGALPGLVALLGSAIWIGRVSTRLDTVEEDLRELRDIKAEVATIAERTKNTAESMGAQATDLRKITEHLLDEGRTFARRILRNEAARGG